MKKPSISEGAAIVGALALCVVAYKSFRPAEPLTTSDSSVTVEMSAVSAEDNKRSLSFVDSGLAKGLSGDYSSAIADLTKAIEINSQYADAYSGRGFEKFKSGSKRRLF